MWNYSKLVRGYAVAETCKIAVHTISMAPPAFADLMVDNDFYKVFEPNKEANKAGILGTFLAARVTIDADLDPRFIRFADDNGDVLVDGEVL